MKATLVGDVVVIPVEGNIIDVFTGNGWENHSRFKVIKGHPQLIKGSNPISDVDFKKLKALL